MKLVKRNKNSLEYKMTVILNIQKMEEIIESPNPVPFEILKGLTYDALSVMQDELIIVYNKKILEKELAEKAKKEAEAKEIANIELDKKGLAYEFIDYSKEDIIKLTALLTDIESGEHESMADEEGDFSNAMIYEADKDNFYGEVLIDNDDTFPVSKIFTINRKTYEVSFDLD